MPKRIPEKTKQRAVSRGDALRPFQPPSRTHAAGEAFLPAARASLEAADRAAADAAAATGQIRGNLTIGVIPTVTAVDIPAALRVFREAHPPGAGTAAWRWQR